MGAIQAKLDPLGLMRLTWERLMPEPSSSSNPDLPNAEKSETKLVWENPILTVWRSFHRRLGNLRLTNGLSQWLSVDEAQIASVLDAVRQELPTTEAILIGKPQAGKSSIVRGLTGVSAEIVGQGFRPYTQNTERYTFPSNDLPLLIFTDTVGIGDIDQPAENIIAELTEEFRQASDRARILIVAVRIVDFAIDTLKHFIQALRREFPEIPCLLVLTCLHETYPNLDNHPPYPPQIESFERTLKAQTETFSGLCDLSVAIDFTLEEDGYTPIFYGLEALQEVIADLLPEAEAQAIHQLLDQQSEASSQLGNLYRDVARRYISAFAIIAATVAAVPLPFATMPVLTTLQVSMVGLLGKLYGQILSPAQAGGILSTIAGGFVAQTVGRELIKMIPGFGSLLAASWAAAYTWALGEGACVYFGDVIGGKTPDPKRIRAAMREAYNLARERFGRRV